MRSLLEITPWSGRRTTSTAAGPQTRGVLATLVARAQALIATALLLSADVLPGGEVLPPF